MLVLRRKHKEQIQLGTEEDFRNGTTIRQTVFVEDIGGRCQVSIGTDAPDDIKIFREEKVDEYLESIGADPIR